MYNNPEVESEEDVLHHNLMVNYLPASYTSDNLKDLFVKFGPVKESIVICDPQTGQSRGYGFVRFTRKADAENAMAEMNGYTVEGKRLVVKKADVGKDVEGAASVYVAGFMPRTGIARELRRLFSTFGTVLDVTLMNPQEGKKGVAFVKFARYADAIAAVENVKEYRKQELVVKIASQTAKKATNWQRLAKDYDDTITLAQHTCSPQSANNVLILYHYPNADATIAALAAYLYLKNYHPELAARDIAMIPHPVYRPSPAPDRLPINQRMTDVFLLGYAGSPEYVQQLAHECNSVTILDHHTAAQDCFAALQEARALPPSVQVVIDSDRSAATLAWDYFTDRAGGSLLGADGTEAQVQRLRRLFEFSEDHALGRHYLPGSRAFAYALQKENLNYNVLENSNIWRILQELSIPDVIAKGEAMLTEQKGTLDTILEKSFVIQIRDPHDPEHGHFGQCLAVLTDHPEGIGEMAYRLAVKSAESGLRAIGAVAFQKLGDANCKVNLRAVNNTDEDTLQIAESFDGANHPRNHPGASSFFVSLETFQSWVIAQVPAPPMPRNLSHTANHLTLQYRVSRPEAYDGIKVDVTPAYFEVALGPSQIFDNLSAPPLLVQNMKQMGFQHCPQVAAAVYPIHVHRDILCLLPRQHSAEHVYLWIVFMGLLHHLDPDTTRLHSLVLCSSISLAQHVYMVAQAYSKGTGARISCVVEPLPKNATLLDCHVLITTPNAAEMLCREGMVNLAYLKAVMIHDTDRILNMFLKHHLVDVLGRIWAVRKRSGVTVGMYTTGSYRLVRQLASDLMEKDADQHVTVTVTDPAEAEVMAPALVAASPADTDRVFNVRTLLEQMQKRDIAVPNAEQRLLAQLQDGGKQPQFSGQVCSIFDMARRATPSQSLPVMPSAMPVQGAGFSGNVQTILSQLPAQGLPGLNMQPAPSMVMQPGPQMPAMVPMNPFPGVQFPGLQLGLPGGSMLAPMAFDVARAQGFGKGMPGPVQFGVPAPVGNPFISQPGNMYGKGNGFGPRGRGKGVGKGVGKGAIDPKSTGQPGSSDGMPRAGGPSGPVYPWQRTN